MVKASSKSGKKAPARFRPGVVARRKGKQLQKSSELIFNHAPMRREALSHTKSVFKEKKARISRNAVKALRKYVELVAIRDIRKALRIMNIANKTTLDGEFFLESMPV